MKIGLVLQGISYGHYNNRTRDYFQCIDNIKKNLIDLYDDVKIYIYSYNSEKNEEILRNYMPYKYSFDDMIGTNQLITKVNALKFIENEDLDFIIFTRFDILFKSTIDSFNINYSKFNFANREEKGNWEKYRYCSDNLYLFPYNMLPNVLKAMNELLMNFSKTGLNHVGIGSHDLYDKLINYIPSDEINFLDVSVENNVYKVPGV